MGTIVFGSSSAAAIGDWLIVAVHCRIGLDGGLPDLPFVREVGGDQSRRVFSDLLGCPVSSRVSAHVVRLSLVDFDH